MMENHPLLSLMNSLTATTWEIYMKWKALVSAKGEFEAAFPSLETTLAVVDQRFTATPWAEDT